MIFFFLIFGREWRHLVSDATLNHDTPVKINQDCNFYVGHVGADPIEFEVKEGRQAYMVCFDGKVTINDQFEVGNQDGGEIKGPGILRIAPNGSPSADILLIEMAKTTDTRF